MLSLVLLWGNTCEQFPKFSIQTKFPGVAIKDIENRKFLVSVIVGAVPSRSALCQLTFSSEIADQFAELEYKKHL